MPVIQPIVDSPASGTLALVAGKLGGPGNLDGIGESARFANITAMAFDDADRRLFVVDGYPPACTLRAIDVDTARVTTLRQLDELTPVLYQRGYVYAPGRDGIAKISATTGALVATLPMPIIEQVIPADLEPGCFVAAPDGDALFYPCSAKLVRIDSTSGSSTAIPYLGHMPSGYNFAAAMSSANTILMADNDNSLTTPIEQLLQIDVSSGVVSVLLDYSIGFDHTSVSAIDPAGQFFVVDDEALPIGAGVVPPLVPYGQIARDSAGTLYIGNYDLLSRWEAPQPTFETMAGRDSGNTAYDSVFPRQGPGTAVTFDRAVMNLSVIGESAFATQADVAGLAVIDLASGAVSLSQLPNSADIAAILAAPDGTYYIAARSSCAVSHVFPDGRPSETLYAGRASCLQRPGANPINPQNRNWATVGLASVGGRLFMSADDTDTIISMDPTQPSAFVTLPFSTTGHDGPTGIAAGTDGQLYVALKGYILRVDPILGGQVPIAVGGARVIADQAGHLFTAAGDGVLRIDIATGATARIIGTAQTSGIALGPLPGGLNLPQALALTSSGDLLIGNIGELVVLRATLQR